MGTSKRDRPSWMSVTVEAMRRALVPLLAGVVLLASCTSTSGSDQSVGQANNIAADVGTPQFSFAAAGDIGATRDTARSLGRLDASDARFFLALGDLDYDQTSSDRAWCRYVKSRLPRKGARFPFQLLVGNHESDDGADGHIRRHAGCLPDRLDSRGKYGRQYSFDYPRANPFATFVMIAPNLLVDGHRYRYDAGTSDRRWLVRQIDNARARGSQWIVVGMHYNCLSTGETHRGCQAGHGLLDLLLKKKVDLLLNGHNHIYERGKQLALSGDCPQIPRGEYDSACVVDSGSDGQYRKGAGMVQVTAGRFGGRPQGLDPDDPDAPYFAMAAAGTTGFVKYTLSRDTLVARYIASSGSVSDSFTISRSG